jgi:cytochrome c1
MSRVRGQPLIQKCLVGLLLSTCCAAFVFATDTDKSKVLEEGVYVDRYLAAEQVIPENAEKPEATAAGADMQRGRLLYETHCIACHTTEAHWREKHIVRSWTDLLYQVSRWQKNAGQDWSSEEINDVAAFLNDTFYKMP